MSRIGKLPVDIPDNVEVTLNEDNQVTIKGPKGELTKSFNTAVDIVKDGEQIHIKRQGEERKDHSLQGMVRSQIDSMVTGVVEGFSKKLEMVGVGYSAQVKGDKLEVEAGYSHPIIIEASDNVSFEVEKKNIINVKGIDKQEVGDVAARIREIRKPEPYKGKGIKYVDERIRRKVGKTG